MTHARNEYKIRARSRITLSPKPTRDAADAARAIAVTNKILLEATRDAHARSFRADT
jgi:hypothetical protein